MFTLKLKIVQLVAVQPVPFKTFRYWGHTPQLSASCIKATPWVPLPVMSVSSHWSLAPTYTACPLDYQGYLHHRSDVISQRTFIVRDAFANYDADLTTQDIRHYSCMHTCHAQRRGLGKEKTEDELVIVHADSCTSSRNLWIWALFMKA